MDIVCRTCLKLNGVYFNIFEYSQNTRLVSDVIMDLTSIKVSKEDGLPHNICNNCLEKLNSANDFKQMVIKSDRELCQLQQSKIIEDGKDLQDIASALICVKEETVVVKSEKIESPTCLSSNNQTTTEDLPLSNCESIWLKGNNISEELDLVSDYGCKSSISILPTENVLTDSQSCLDSNLIDKYTSDSDKSVQSENQVATVKKNIRKKSYIRTKNKASIKAYNLLEERLKFIDNPDCKKIMESELSAEERNRAMVRCEVCNQTLTFRYYVQVHMHYHTGNLSFKCHLCDLKFPSKQQLKLHIGSHSQKRRYACDKCNKSYTFKNQLKLHETTHLEKYPHKCNICEKSYKTLKLLRSHKLYHSSVRQFVCEDCGKSYITKRDLRNHQVRYHSEVEKIACKICGKLLAHKDSLRQHLLCHVPTKLLDCSTCGKQFGFKKHLKAHMVIHTNKKPYSCQVCGKSFKHNWAVMRHMLIHTGETPHSCKLCTASFKYTYLLKSHMKEHDKGGLEEEEVKDPAI